MTDLLTPEKVREMIKLGVTWHHIDKVDRLCCDYLTLWDELEHERELSDKAVKRVRELENEVKSLRGFKQSVDEAVNMGDGSYRP